MADISLSFYSHSLARSVPLRAFIPVDAADASPTAPVTPLPALYLLHGLNGCERDWFQYTRVALWARQKRLAVICPAGENSFYVNRADSQEACMTFIGEELPAFTRNLFPLSRRREDTFIGGLSMGGYGALNAGFLYPETFGKVAALSAALHFWTRMNDDQAAFVLRPAYARALFGNDPSAWDTEKLAEACGKDKAPKLFLGCGAEDDLLDMNKQLDARLTSLGIRHEFRVSSGAHTWDYWDSTIHDVLDWLLP